MKTGNKGSQTTYSKKKVKGKERDEVYVEERLIEEESVIMKWRQDSGVQWLLEQGILLGYFTVIYIF